MPDRTQGPANGPDTTSLDGPDTGAPDTHAPAAPEPAAHAPAAHALAAIRAHAALGGGGAYLGVAGGRWVWGGAEHATLVLGPPRSGKSSAVVVPSVVAAPGPVVCTSTKPDIAAVTAAARRRQGPCFLYDPSGTVPPVPGVAPLRWSPVPACARWDAALLMAGGMVDAAGRAAGQGDHGGHWTERAGALLAPLLHAAALQGADMATVVRWVDRHQPEQALAALDDAGATTAADLLAGIAATDEREQSGIWSTASGTLRAYRSDAALQGTARPDAAVGDLLDAGATIYVCASARHQAATAPLVVGLLTEVRAAVYARAAAWEAAGRQGAAPPRALFALDEVANIAPLPDLPAMVSEAGGQGLTVLACLQDLSQARRRWGPDADGLLSLFGTTVILPGIGDVRTLQAVSALVGDHQVVQRSWTGPAGGSRRWPAVAGALLLGPGRGGAGQRQPSATLATTRQRRLPVEAIAQGRPGAALVLDRRNRAGWVGLTPWFATEPWAAALAPGRARRSPAPDLGHGR